MLLDSNIIIYASKPEYPELRRFIAEHATSVSAISLVEVLGYHLLKTEELSLLEAFFAAATLLPITQAVLREAVRLRQARKMSLGDALVAATALGNDLQLATSNTRDFAWIPGIKLLNPLDPVS